MTRRLISSTRSDIQRMAAQELKQSIQASEGRVLLAQTMGFAPALVDGITNVELEQAYGADMIMLNGYSLTPEASMPGLDVEEYIEDKGYVRKQYRLPDLRRLIDIPMGIYLECGLGMNDASATANEWDLLSKGRVANEENLQRVKAEEADFVVLGGNPGTGTTMDRIIEFTRNAKKILGDEVLIFSGKWEDGVTEKVLGDPLSARPANEVIKDLIDAGADVICLPMPGSRTGITINMISECVEFTHRYKPGTLALGFLDGSVEGSDIDTIRECALMSKQTGVDIHAIGDAGYFGVAVPENLYQMSITLKGKRLTYRRLAGRRR